MGKKKKEEIVISDPPEFLCDLNANIALLSALAVGGYFLFTTEGTVRAILLALVAGIGTFFGMVIIGAALLVITSHFYRGWDKHFSSWAEYEAWKAQEEEDRKRKREEAQSQQKELKRAREEQERRQKEARERRLRQVKEERVRLIAKLEADPVVAQTLRDVKRRAPKDAGEQLLARAEAAIAGLGGWLAEQGISNQLPGHWLGGQAKGRIEGHFASLSPKEKVALQKYLPRVAQVLEEALEAMSPREVVKEVLLPLFFGEA